MDTRLDENEAELGVLVLAVALEVLADSDGLKSQVSIRATEGLRGKMVAHPGHGNERQTYLLDQHVQILGHVGGEACQAITLSAW